MRRLHVLGALVAVGGLSLVVHAYQQPNAPRQVQVDQIRPNLWVLRGGGGNTAVFERSNGVVVVDTKNPGWGQPILDAIKGFTNKPVTTIINTHTHADHVSGNVEFPANIDIVVQDNTKANMEAMRPVTGLAAPPPGPSIFQQNNGKGLPTRTFRDRLTLGSGADEIDLYYFGRAHTNGDAYVLFPALRVLHAGDTFAGKDLPILDANNGGSGVEIADTLTKASDMADGKVDTIITGHDGTMTVADMRQFAAFNRAFLDFARAAQQAGKSVEQAAAEWKTPASFSGYAEPQAARIRTNVQVIYDELNRAR
jgi:glyoxylase-like metal-dependent hydrolase (beta-lactamase superfamily II)